jgi:transposase
MADKIRDGTDSKGEKCNSAKLTEEQVKTIRASTKTQRALAKEYGVSQPVITRIINRKIWTHI